MFGSSQGSLPFDAFTGNALTSRQDHHSTTPAATVDNASNIIHMQNIVPLGNLESLRQSMRTNDSRMSRANKALSTDSAEHSERNVKRSAQVVYTDQKTREGGMRVFSPQSSAAGRISPRGKQYDYYKPEKIKVQKMNIESAMDANDYVMDFDKHFEKSDEADLPVYGSLALPSVKATLSPVGTNPLDESLDKEDGDVKQMPFPSGAKI